MEVNLGLTELLHLPEEFSVEFTFYAVKEGEGSPYAFIYLHSGKGIAEWRSEGEEQFVELRTYNLTVPLNFGAIKLAIGWRRLERGL